MPCHHTLEEYLHAYIDGAGRLTRTPLPRANAYAMIRRRGATAGQIRGEELLTCHELPR